MKLNDVRRRKHPMYAQPATQALTALDFRASMLKDGSRVPAGRCCHAVLCDVEIAEPEADVEEAEADEDQDLQAEAGEVVGGSEEGVIAVSCTVHKGWKCSYRSQLPEQKCFSALRKRWQRSRLRWDKYGVNLLAPAVKRTEAAQLQMHEGWRKRRLHRRAVTSAAAAAAPAAA